VVFGCPSPSCSFKNWYLHPSDLSPECLISPEFAGSRKSVLFFFPFYLFRACSSRFSRILPPQRYPYPWPSSQGVLVSPGGLHDGCSFSTSSFIPPPEIRRLWTEVSPPEHSPRRCQAGVFFLAFWVRIVPGPTFFCPIWGCYLIGCLSCLRLRVSWSLVPQSVDFGFFLMVRPDEVCFFFFPEKFFLFFS